MHISVIVYLSVERLNLFRMNVTSLIRTNSLIRTEFFDLKYLCSCSDEPGCFVSDIGFLLLDIIDYDFAIESGNTQRGNAYRATQSVCLIFQRLQISLKGLKLVLSEERLHESGFNA